MLSSGRVIGAAVRVVVFTPLLLGMYALSARPRAVAMATLGGFDPGALAGVILGLPGMPLALPAFVLVPILGPSLQSRSDMNA